MIKAIEDYISELYPTMTYGQIAEEDKLINMSIHDTGNSPFFNDTKTHIFNINLFIRDTSYEVVRDKNEEIGTKLNNIFDVNISNIHIVDTKKTGSQEPFRDEKNRYGIYSTFEMWVEEL